MKALEYIQTLGLAEILITLALILIVAYGIYDSKKSNKEHEANVKRFEKRRNPFECPYDLESCDYVDTSTSTITKNCKDCKRYDNGVRPSKF